MLATVLPATVLLERAVHVVPWHTSMVLAALSHWMAPLSPAVQLEPVPIWMISLALMVPTTSSVATGLLVPWPVLPLLFTYKLGTHPAKAAGATSLAQAAAWSAKDFGFQFHGSNWVILLAG